MPDIEYPRSAAEVVATLAELFEHQQENATAQLLRASHSQIEHVGHDNLDGGIEYFALVLQMPVSLLAPIEADLENLQKKINKKLSRCFPIANGFVLNDCQIGAFPSEPRGVTGHSTVSDLAAGNIWEPRFFRLFLSHVAIHKVGVSLLKRELAVFGISGFIAHEDIEPSLEWQAEIEKALGSMDALAALLTTEFPQSKWTDQEVGFAYARVPVIPVNLGVMPYGFIGKQQALFGDLENSTALSLEIVESLLSNPRTAARMRDALVFAFENAQNYDAAKRASRVVVATTGFSAAQVKRLERACEANSQVKDAFGVKVRISSFVQRINPPVPKADVLADDDIPF
jgi:hypothetical protein